MTKLSITRHRIAKNESNHTMTVITSMIYPNTVVFHLQSLLNIIKPWGVRFPLKDKYPNFEVGLKCILTVNPYLLVCSYIKYKSDVNKYRS